MIVQRCKKLQATVWQKLITVAKGKAKIELSPFSCFYKFPFEAYLAICGPCQNMQT